MTLNVYLRLILFFFIASEVFFIGFIYVIGFWVCVFFYASGQIQRLIRWTRLLQ